MLSFGHRDIPMNQCSRRYEDECARRELYQELQLRKADMATSLGVEVTSRDDRTYAVGLVRHVQVLDGLHSLALTIVGCYGEECGGWYRIYKAGIRSPQSSNEVAVVSIELRKIITEDS